jgi:hypothetical protein
LKKGDKRSRNKKNFQQINWTIFGILVVIGGCIAISILVSLGDAVHTTGEESYRDFRWVSAASTLLTTLLLFTAVLIFIWKRIFPFNVPLVIILLGFYFELFFLIFTTGWIGFMGIFGLAIAVIIALIMIIVYAIYLLK